MAAGGSDFVDVYRLNDSNGQYIKIGDSIQGTADTSFGYKISLSFDGTRLIVGSKYNDEGGVDIGRSFLYKVGEDAWEAIEEFGGEAAGDWSGYAVAMSGNGERLVIGATKSY